MVANLCAHLETLVDRLLDERSALLQRLAQLSEQNATLTAERDDLLADRVRIDAELGRLVGKLDDLGRG
ncbi:MAG: hypothetical protein RQ723_12215 [Desulfuromonadales bacterium]|nr:hypothetical protein [Desulfuromonadales bacterium]